MRFSESMGGWYSLDDFANQRSEWVEPQVSQYRGYDLYEIPPNGQGIAASRNPALPTSGLGLRNMQERVEQLDGTLRILSSRTGTVIVAEVPLTHILTPQDDGPEKTRKASA